MLDRVQSTFVGNTQVRTTITGEMDDIGRRLTEGDATLGWEGADDLTLHLAQQFEIDQFGNAKPTRNYHFEVWGIDGHGQPYLALSWPRCDASLLRRLSEIDNRKTSVLDRTVKLMDQARRDKESAEADKRGEMAERLAFALKKDLGHHHGGLTKSIH